MIGKNRLIGIFLCLGLIVALLSCSSAADTSTDQNKLADFKEVSFRVGRMNNRDMELLRKYPIAEKKIECQVRNGKGDVLKVNYYLYCVRISQDVIIDKAKHFANYNANVVCMDTISYQDSLLIRFAEEDVKKAEKGPLCTYERILNTYLRQSIVKKGIRRTFRW